MFVLNILDIVEIERQRIAKDLHDISLQDLSHLIHKIELSSLYIEKDPIKAKLELATTQQELRKVIEEMRTIIYNMYPFSLEDLGLKATVEKVLYIINQDFNFTIESDIDNVSCENNNVKSLYLLRLIQECCHNAVKHSQGDKLFVSLKEKNHKYHLKVADNGKGFYENKNDKKNCHFGLSIMKETVQMLHGKIKIDTSEKGTIIEIEIPF